MAARSSNLSSIGPRYVQAILPHGGSARRAVGPSFQWCCRTRPPPWGCLTLSAVGDRGEHSAIYRHICGGIAGRSEKTKLLQRVAINPVSAGTDQALQPDRSGRRTVRPALRRQLAKKSEASNGSASPESRLASASATAGASLKPLPLQPVIANTPVSVSSELGMTTVWKRGASSV